MQANDRAIVGMTMLGHAMVHTYELSIPVLITVWLDVFTVDTATIGVVVAAGYTLFGVGSLPGGILTDRFGSKRLIILCLLGMGGAFILVGAAPNIFTLTGGLLAWGAAASLYHPAGLSLISTGVEERGRGFAYHGMAGNIGTAIGPFVTTLLLVVLDWRIVTGLLSVPAGVAAIIAFRLNVVETAAVEVADGGQQLGRVSSLEDLLRESRVLFRSSYLLVFGIVVIAGLYYRGVLTFLPDLLSGFVSVSLPGVESLSTGRYLYAGILMVGILGQYIAGRLTDYWEVERGLAVAFGGLTVISVVFSVVIGWGFVALLVISGLLGVFLFGEQPFSQATIAKHSPAETRGLAYGYMYLGVFGIGALGAAMTGYILALASPEVLFLVLGGIAAVAAGLAVVVFQGWVPGWLRSAGS